MSEEPSGGENSQCYEATRGSSKVYEVTQTKKINEQKKSRISDRITNLPELEHEGRPEGEESTKPELRSDVVAALARHVDVHAEPEDSWR